MLCSLSYVWEPQQKKKCAMLFFYQYAAEMINIFRLFSSHPSTAALKKNIASTFHIEGLQGGSGPPCSRIAEGCY